MYTQNDPWEPVVSFEDYIRNNEDIVNQVSEHTSTAEYLTDEAYYALLCAGPGCLGDGRLPACASL